MQEMGILTGGVIHKDEARISGGGLRRRFPSLAQQPFRREDSAQNGAERNPLPLGDLPDGMAFDEVLDQHEAVDRRDLTQCAEQAGAAFRMLRLFGKVRYDQAAGQLVIKDVERDCFSLLA